MKLNLQKPLVIFDLETTGLDIVKDHIIQISYIKIYPDGREVRGNELVNPEKPIPNEVAQLTGITNDDVKDKPTFKQLAAKMTEVFTGADIAGFNSTDRRTDHLPQDGASQPRSSLQVLLWAQDGGRL